MKRDIEDFLEEITDNFSKLFVEAFLIRYLNEFDKRKLANYIELVKEKLKNKVDSNFATKLNKILK